MFTIIRIRIRIYATQTFQATIYKNLVKLAAPISDHTFLVFHMFFIVIHLNLTISAKNLEIRPNYDMRGRIPGL